MALKVPTVGEAALLKDMLGVTAPGALTIKLYVNDKTPADDDVAASYTEMSTHGYASKTIATTDWTVADNAGAAEATAVTQTWTFTADPAAPVYGYFIVDAAGVLRWAERFATSFLVEFANDTAIVTPKFSLASA